MNCLQLSKDGLVYGCDRQRDRVQVFRKDGTFVREAVLAKDTPAGAGITLKGPLSAGVRKACVGSVFRVGFSADSQQQYLYVAGNSKIWILRRSDLQVLGSFDAGGPTIWRGPTRKETSTQLGGEVPLKFQFTGVPTTSLGR